MQATVIGAGLAGSEAAWYLANKGVNVRLVEMRPTVSTKAHKTDKCAELVCSNSLKNSELNNAAGLLKEEMRLLGSIVMEAGEASRVPAGAAFAVDRGLFSDFITRKIKSHPLISFATEEAATIPECSGENPVIIATGPLTSPKLVEEIAELTGTGNLFFFDAIAPIFFAESLDLTKLYKRSRYDKGGDDYLNLPLSRDEYLCFVNATMAAEKYTGKEEVENDSVEKLRLFEGCMPIEDMIGRGENTLRFGPLKPKGLIDPSTGKEPYAVIQLRQDDVNGHTWSMVGMQTRLKRHEQEKIFRSLPGLEQAEFARYGSFHRNTFIDSPKFLNATLEFRAKRGLFFAGQITGTEGYLESAIGGIVAGINAFRLLSGKMPVVFPVETATGAILNYISDSNRKEFQPINITYGIMPSYFKIETKAGKKERKLLTSELAIKTMKNFINTAIP